MSAEMETTTVIINKHWNICTETDVLSRVSGVHPIKAIKGISMPLSNPKRKEEENRGLVSKPFPLLPPSIPRCKPPLSLPSNPHLNPPLKLPSKPPAQALFRLISLPPPSFLTTSVTLVPPNLLKVLTSASVSSNAATSSPPPTLFPCTSTLGTVRRPVICASVSCSFAPRGCWSSSTT